MPSQYQKNAIRDAIWVLSIEGESTLSCFRGQGVKTMNFDQCSSVQDL